MSSYIFKLTLLWLLIIPVIGNAQNLTQNIRGVVRDADTQLPLAGATVMIPEQKAGAYTDEEGRFIIANIPVGRHHLMVSFMGYEPYAQPNLLLSSGKELFLNINLTESVVQLDEVVIQAQEGKNNSINELSVVSTRAFTVDETKNYAGSFDDPSRMALSFAGVGGGEDDEENEIIIRGNSPKSLLWKLEGVEIPSPNHFTEEGASSGAVSILSSNMLANSDFSTGAFPAEYGNALSGVFDIRLRNGNNQQMERAFSVGVLGIDFALEGPFKEGYDGSYLVNYRYSSLALLQKAGLNIVGDAVPVFQDLSFKVNLPTRKLGTFSIFGIGGLSHIEEQDTDEQPNGQEIVNWQDRYESNMGVTGMNHKLVIGEKTLINSAVSLSGTAVKYQWQPRNELGEYPVEETEDFINLSLRVQSTLTHKFNSRHLVKAGAIYSRLGYDLLTEYLNNRDQWVTELDDKGWSNVWQGFVSYRFRLNDRITFNGGLHSMYFTLNNRYTIEPRASFKWQIDDQQYISAGFGVHSRREGLSLYLARETEWDGSYSQPNIDLDFTKARHFVLGYDRMLTGNLHLRLETYYQQLYDVPVFNTSEIPISLINSVSPFTTEPLVNKGTGRNYGVEMTLEKFFANDYFFLITASLFESKYASIDGVEHSTRFNNNHISNFLLGKEFRVGKEKQNRITTSARVIWAGGKRYTPINTEASARLGYTVRDWSRAYESQTPDYFRADLSVGYVINKKTTTQTIKLDIQNVTNRTNIVNIFYSPRDGKFIESRRGSIIPVLSYKLQF